MLARCQWAGARASGRSAGIHPKAACSVEALNTLRSASPLQLSGQGRGALSTKPADRVTPNCVPIKAPTSTAPANSGRSGGSARTDETFPSPAIEFARMKTAATPLAVRVSDHPANKRMGERKIPPPVPVRPERKPTRAPARMPGRIGGSRGSRFVASSAGIAGALPPRTAEARQAACSIGPAVECSSQKRERDGR
jgi:hypothetical protein